jgi:hypothetical protein
VANHPKNSLDPHELNARVVSCITDIYRQGQNYKPLMNSFVEIFVLPERISDLHELRMALASDYFDWLQKSGCTNEVVFFDKDGRWML